MALPKLENPFEFITERGRKEATVFTGFCSKHDKELFAPIEDNFFDRSHHHVFLCAYRAFVQGYHRRMEEINEMKQFIDIAPAWGAGWANAYCKSCEVSIQDFDCVKKQCDEAIISKNYDVFRSVVWEFDFPVQFSCTGFSAPTYDFEGNILQNLKDFATPVKHYFITVFPEPQANKSYCIFAWLKENDIFFSEIRTQLNNKTIQEQIVFLNKLAPLMCENFVFNPDFWDKWSDSQRSDFSRNVLNQDYTMRELNSMRNPLYDLFEQFPPK